MQPGDLELLALGEVDLNHFDPLTLERPTTADNPALITTFPRRG